jgi:hypothetical protein
MCGFHVFPAESERFSLICSDSRCFWHNLNVFQGFVQNQSLIKPRRDKGEEGRSGEVGIMRGIRG